MTVVWTKIADNNEELELEEGQVCRVLSIIDASSALIELRNGNTARIAGAVDANLSVGDVFFVSDTNATHLPPESWPSGDRTGTIVWADDDDVVVKSSGSTFAFPQRKSEPFQKGQTVRLGPDGQPIAVIADQTIDSFELSHEDSFDVESLIRLFEVNRDGVTT